jgi:thiol-disulfide isomerase/thioredoxin
MKLKRPGLWLALFCFASTVAWAETPSADQVMAKAEAQAQAEHKTIFVHFGASWCGWCGRLEGFLERPEIKPVFDKYFVQVSLVTQEEDKKAALNNPGADKLMEKLGGAKEIPYYAFLDAQGALIVNSKRPSAEPGGENIGFPVEPKELEWFRSMLQKAAPNISKAELDTIEATLKSMGK